MKSLSFQRVILLSCLSLLGPASRALAYTSADYYNAGLQLYKSQNYAQSVQYLNAALGMDPNNAAALQLRANCYYAQGQYQQALDDYQKVEAVNPSPQLAQFIQNLQAKVGASSPAPPAAGAPASPSPTASSPSFDQGVAYYQQRQYGPAVQMFQKAVQEDPNNAKAYYYLGVCQVQTGDIKDGAVALGISNLKQPNSSVQAYVNQLKSRLTPDDQQWVDAQIARGGETRMAKTPQHKDFGIRLEPAILFPSLGDFNTNAQSWTNEASTVQKSAPDPSLSYNGAVPAGSLNFACEPVLYLSQNLQVGLPLAVMPIGNATDALQDNNSVTVTDSYQITAVSVGLDLRYFLGTGDFQPYICAGGMVVPMNVDYSASAFESSAQVYSASGTFTGVAVGGQVSAGLDWHLGDTFTIAPFAGFQFASGNSFQATVNNSGSAGTGQTAQLEVVPTSVGSVITPVSNGKLVLPVLNGTQASLPAGSTIPAGSRPLDMDLTGPFAGIQISAAF